METGDILNTFKKNVGIIGVVIIAALARIIPHIPNVAPIAGLALFSGATLKTKRAYLLPLSAMLLSDLVLGFHDTMIFVYGSFFLIALLGRWLKNTSPFKLLGMSLSSSVSFFLITNFGVWLVSEMYPKTPLGLYNAYILGLPFLRNTIFGDTVYSFAFFYGYQLITVVSFKTQKLKV